MADRWQIGGRCHYCSVEAEQGRGSQPGRKGAVLPRRTVAKKPRNRKELHIAGGTVLERGGLSDRCRARRIQAMSLDIYADG